MKKRMLITTIVMLLVLAVALTTSSLAWFSAGQATVTATGGQFVASTATAGNVNLAISNDMSSWGVSAAMQTATAGMYPVALREALATTLGEDGNSTLYFDTAQTVQNKWFDPSTIASSTGADLTKDNVDAAANAYHYWDTLYVINQDDTSALAKLTLTMNATVTAASGKALPKAVALFRVSKQASSAESDEWEDMIDYVVVVLDQTSTNYTVYDLDALKGEDMYDNALLTSAVTQTGTQSAGVNRSIDESSNTSQTVLTATFDLSLGEDGLAINMGEIAKIDVVCWFDGSSLGSSTQGATITFSLTIGGTAK